MVEFKRNKETGELETWKDGQKVGTIVTMGDIVMKEGEDDSRYRDRDSDR